MASKTVLHHMRMRPVSGLFLALDEKGRIVKRMTSVRNGFKPKSEWVVYDPDVLSLALEGRLEELEIVTELLAIRG